MSDMIYTCIETPVLLFVSTRKSFAPNPSNYLLLKNYERQNKNDNRKSYILHNIKMIGSQNKRNRIANAKKKTLAVKTYYVFGRTETMMFKMFQKRKMNEEITDTFTDNDIITVSDLCENELAGLAVL